MTVNHLRFSDQNRSLQFHASCSRYRIDWVRPVQNRNMSPFVVSPDLHHALARSTPSMSHPAKCKFVAHSMAHCHAEIRMVNDDGRSNKIHATAMGTSADRGRKNAQVKHFICDCDIDYGWNIHVKCRVFTFSRSICLVGACFSSCTIIDSMPAIFCLSFSRLLMKKSNNTFIRSS